MRTTGKSLTKAGGHCPACDRRRA